MAGQPKFERRDFDLGQNLHHARPQSGHAHMQRTDPDPGTKSAYGGNVIVASELKIGGLRGQTGRAIGRDERWVPILPQQDMRL